MPAAAVCLLFGLILAQQHPWHAVTGAEALPPSLQLASLHRCHGIRSSHCSEYYLQPLVDLKPPRVHSKPCPKDCSGLGVCAGDTGRCDCPAGVGGPDCSAADPRPCTNGYRTNRSSLVPASHIGANKRDLNWSAPGWTSSRCAGVCDDATGICYCDGPHFGRVPAPEGAPPGTPPIRPGRLLHGNCQRLISDDKGQRLNWGSKPGMSYEDIYGAAGWCTVDQPFVRCSCDMDGVDGKLCEVKTETLCPNQCSGHGTCSRGFCACFPGWYGLDCARLSDPEQLLVPPPATSNATASSPVAGEQPTAAAAGAATGSDAAGGDAAAAGAGNKAAESSSTGAAGDLATPHGMAEEEAAGRAAPGSLNLRLPRHLALLAEHPYLADHFVGAWAAATAAVTAGGHAVHDGAALVNDAAAAAAKAADAAAVGAGQAAAAAGGGGGGSSSPGEVQAPAIPALYFTPLSAEEAESGAAAAAAAAAGDAGSVNKEAIEQEHNRQRRRALAAVAPTAPAAADALSAAAGAGVVQHTNDDVDADAGDRASDSDDGSGDAEGGQQAEDTADALQQQQQLRRARRRRQRRSLLRHFWTGGGSQRAAMSIAPSQAAVDAAVTDFLQLGRSGGGGNVAALNGALAASGVRLDRLSRASDVAVLQRMVEVGLGAPLPPGKARRPRIFVYDMPSRFVGRLLRYRPSKHTCTWRVFSKGNYSIYTTTDSESAWRYPLESHLHELMLQSPHRTLDPEQADFFYVPVYATCFMEAVAGWADTPWWYTHSESAVKQGVFMYLDALNWLRTTYPYWNASAGANHIWLFDHDEGACWAPAEIYNASIILSQWGRLSPPTYKSRNGPVTESLTSRFEYNYNKIEPRDDPAAPPGGYGAFITGHPCYTPGKDLVLPAFRPPPRYAASPFMGGDASRGRDILLLLRGDLGGSRPGAYSRGIRQRLAKLAREGGWRARHRIWIGTERELEGDSSALLARSRFCLVVPRHGWSGGLEDAVLHGCIPVVVLLPGEASAAQPFSGLLRLSSAVLKVSANELAALPEILAAVSEPEEAELRRQAGRWWSCMAWLSHPWLRRQAAALVAENLGRHPRVKDALEQLAVAQAAAKQAMGARSSHNSSDVMTGGAEPSGEDAAAQTAALFDVAVWRPDAPLDDAFTTLIQWLHYKMRRPYKVSERRSGSNSNSTYAVDGAVGSSTGGGSSSTAIKKHTRHAMPVGAVAVTTERRQ